MEKSITLSKILILLLVFLIYSSASIMMKFSSSSESVIVSLLYLLAAFGILGVYAILWQQILKNTPLSMAFMFKSVTIVYGMFFAAFIFDEKISTYNIMGALMIMIGIVVLGWES